MTHHAADQPLDNEMTNSWTTRREVSVRPWLAVASSRNRSSVERGTPVELGYARLSTTHPDLQRQLAALGEYGIPPERIYQDAKTGAASARPGFEDLLRAARTGDTIVTASLDRLGHNVRECLGIVDDLREQRIGVKTPR